MTALVKGGDVDIVGSVFLYNATSLFIRVERIHQNKWNIHIMSLVEVLQNGVYPTMWSIPNILSTHTHPPYSPFLYRLLTSIWRTLRSKNVIPSRTSIADLGPTQPIVVPRPPFNLRTASLSRSLDAVHSGNSLYATICSGEGDWIFSQSLSQIVWVSSPPSLVLILLTAWCPWPFHPWNA